MELEKVNKLIIYYYNYYSQNTKDYMIAIVKNNLEE